MRKVLDRSRSQSLRDGTQGIEFRHAEISHGRSCISIPSLGGETNGSKSIKCFCHAWINGLYLGVKMHTSGLLTSENIKLGAAAARKISCKVFHLFFRRRQGTLLAYVPRLRAYALLLKLPKMQLKLEGR